MDWWWFDWWNIRPGNGYFRRCVWIGRRGRHSGRIAGTAGAVICSDILSQTMFIREESKTARNGTLQAFQAW